MIQTPPASVNNYLHYIITTRLPAPQYAKIPLRPGPAPGAGMLAARWVSGVRPTEHLAPAGNRSALQVFGARHGPSKKHLAAAGFHGARCSSKGGKLSLFHFNYGCAHLYLYFIHKYDGFNRNFRREGRLGHYSVRLATGSQFGIISTKPQKKFPKSDRRGSASR